MTHQHRSAVPAPAAVGRPLAARSTLVPRSTQLSSGGIAGAVVGSVIGALLIAFCAYPFIVRALRRRRERHAGDDLAEMGQAPGGPITAAVSQDPDRTSYKGSSGSAPDMSTTTQDSPQPQTTTTTTSQGQKQSSTVPDGVTVQQGLPSPASSPSPTSPTSPAAHPASPAPGADSPKDASPPARSPTEQSQQSHRASKDRESSRERSVSDSTRSPSRQLTGFGSGGITEEPESFDNSTPAQEPTAPKKGSIRSFFSRRRSSRRESRRSTLVDPPGTSTRSPTLLTDDFIPQPIQPVQPVQVTPSFQVDTEVRGLAWDYYNDPTLDLVINDPSFSQPAVLPPDHPLASGPVDPSFPQAQAAAPGFGLPQPITSKPIAAEPGTDANILPVDFSRQSTLLQQQPSFPGSLQRTDTFPLPEIVSDISSPPLTYDTGPSAHPMHLMPPTTLSENAWYLEHGMPSMQNSPPPPVPEPVSSMSMPQNSTPAPVHLQTGDVTKISTPPSCPPNQTPYQSPPPSALEPGSDLYEETVKFYEDQLNPVEYSTPPPSNGPSVNNTPETRLLHYPGSPSPAGEPEPTMQSHMGMPLPQVSVGLSPASGFTMVHPQPSHGVATLPSPSQTTAGPSTSPNLSAPLPSPGLSPTPSRGRSPDPSPGRSPGRSPAPPGGYVCEVCGAVKKSYHQFNHHKRYHERPWQCQQCDRSFGTITHLKRHINDKHEKTRKFYCTQPGCEYSRLGTKSFPRKDNWKRHMLKKHAIDPQNDTDEDYLGDDSMMDLVDARIQHVPQQS
ncbi:hypothetical protein VTJ04DRAFT_2644 [Mycothermus thermophilus]|uniref:uncharacterized protein n=1 Tax=Humicola insolens TaxID=85995 RepID=UPI0037425407